MSKNILGAPEKWGSVHAHARKQNTVRRAALAWSQLGVRRRREIARHLLEHIAPPCNNFAAIRKNGVCRRKTPARLCVVARQHRLCSDVLIDTMTRQELHGEHPICATSAVYLSLYYSSVSGSFSLNNFVPQYKEANNF
ncbi:hypothetical protein K2Q08_03250 [Patescibacteria group bacterium]|nr:hypothetical protein [Patescibacteria group bacterium]